MNHWGMHVAMRQVESMAAHLRGRIPHRLLCISPVIICSGGRQQPGAQGMGRIAKNSLPRTAIPGTGRAAGTGIAQGHCCTDRTSSVTSAFKLAAGH